MATASALTFAIEYVIWVFLACCGVLQLVAWYNHLDGLLLAPRRSLASAMGAALLAGSFVWFFASRNRNVPDTAEGIAGSAAFGLFVLGCALALLFTLILSSFLSPVRRREPPPGSRGLEALQQTTYLKALRASLEDQWRHWRGRTRQ